MANKEKLLALADAIVTDTKHGWDIRYSSTCYMGWANRLFPQSALAALAHSGDNNYAATARRELGLTPREAAALFYPLEADQMLGDGAKADLWITREVAAETLRNFANTGVIRFVRPLVQEQVCPESDVIRETLTFRD